MRPNVLFFIMDDLPLDDVGCYYGGGRVMTPAIDVFAQDSVKFSRAYCSSAICTPSRYTYLTGEYASRNNDPLFKRENPEGEICKVNFNVAINSQIPTFMQVLHNNNYFTGYVGKWHCGQPFEEIYPKRVAFDADPKDREVDLQIKEIQQMMQKQVRDALQCDFAKSIFWSNIDEMPIEKLRKHNLEWLTVGALDFLDAKPKDKPFCLHVATSSFHGPNHDQSLLEADARYTWSGYMPELGSANEERRIIKEQIEKQGLEVDHHTAGAYWSDCQFKKIIDKLKDMGVYDDTIIVFAVDHGIEPGKASCYELGTRIPLLIKYPQSESGGRVYDEMVQNIDIAPTLFDMLQIVPPDAMKLDGVSIDAILNGCASHETLYFEVGFYRAVIKNGFKYITLRYPKRIYEQLVAGELESLPNQMDMPKQHQPYITMDYYKNALDPDQLYNLNVDPKEQYNLYAEDAYREIAEDLRRELEKYIRALPYPYDLEDYSVFEHPDFRKWKQGLVAKGLSPVSWWSHENTVQIDPRISNILCY